MPSSLKTMRNQIASIDASEVDLSSLVGREVTIYTDQFQGKALQTKVVMVAGNMITVDRGGGGGMIDCLINNQRAIIQFEHKGQRISVGVVLKRTSGGKCSLLLGEKVVPLVRRRFRRYELVTQVRCAVLPPGHIDARRISKLRWIETESINFSSGGVLICLPKHLSKDAYLLLNLGVKDFKFPPLVIGQVRYSYPIDRFRHRIGSEFIVNDVKEKHFAKPLIKSLPPVVFDYTASRRFELDRELASKMKES
ncbi:MAG: hypothetical protein JSW34_08640 [Candidatus Zixiibacteriota bacterium]|nr:MAG: hypothetical protein JSW34_08640 [candidate division Zixibacteria bacterium]